ncbi:MAG: DUF2017 domain-containing protein [Aeromicrobium sp.]
MKPFKRRRRGRIFATFEAGEAQMLANLCGQVVELLRDRNGVSESEPDPLFSQVGMSGPLMPPDDPVLLRLLPDAYRDDPEDAAEFRRYTEQSLSAAKVANAEQLIGSPIDGGLSFEEGDVASSKQVEVELDGDTAQAWLRALTDIRLSLAVRLGIETEEDLMLIASSEEESIAAMAEIYDWLGYVQESLLASLG